MAFCSRPFAGVGRCPLSAFDDRSGSRQAVPGGVADCGAEQLHPHLLEAACLGAGQPLTLRRHAGYDHGYYFIASVVEDHLRHHARALCA